MNRPQFFRAFHPPRTPAALRARVLAAVAERVARRENLLDRLWRSRAWWLGWAGAVALLLAAEAPPQRSPSLVQLQRLELERLGRIEALLAEPVSPGRRLPPPAIDPGWSGA